MTKEDEFNIEKLKRAEISTDPHELGMLSKEKNYFIRANVARNSHTPEHILIELAFDDRSYVSYSLVKYNTTCPEDIFILARAARLIKYDLEYNGHLPNCP